MTSCTLRFAPIALPDTAEVCVAFRVDSFVCSYGTAERFYGPDGQGVGRYLNRLRERSAELPGSCVHAWLNDEIVGQIELRLDRLNPRAGYVNLFYLVAALRGRGLAGQLDAYAVDFFLGLGMSGATLSVGGTNERALRFYLKNDWRDRGPLDGDSGTHCLEKIYSR